MARRSDHSREQLADMAVAAAAMLAERDGLRGVTARGVAREIGYTVGTLYNVFDNLDDVLLHMNAATMDALYEHVTAVPVDADPEQALRTLARRYLEYVREHPRLWSAVIEFEPHAGAPAPEWYAAKAQRLVQLGYEREFGSRNPFDFMELQDVAGLSNFFERTVSSYQVGIKGDVAFDEDF